jgi:hypothetical protein
MGVVGQGPGRSRAGDEEPDGSRLADRTGSAMFGHSSHGGSG